MNNFSKKLPYFVPRVFSSPFDVMTFSSLEKNEEKIEFKKDKNFKKKILLKKRRIVTRTFSGSENIEFSPSWNLNSNFNFSFHQFPHKKRKSSFLLFHGKENVVSDFFLNFSFDKGRLKTLVSWFLENYGQYKTIELLEKLKQFGFGYASFGGLSLGIDDLKIPDQKIEFMIKAETQVAKDFMDYRNSKITGIERMQRLIYTWNETNDMLKQEVLKYFETTDLFNPIYMMAFSGARGNMSQVRQLVGMRGLMSDPQGQIIDFPIQSNFREGLTLTEYLISTYGARKGIVDTALRTATAGYLTRRLVDVAQHVIVSQFDCGTMRGIYLFDMKEANKTIYSFQNRLIGRVLAQDIFSFENLDQSIQKNEGTQIAMRNQEIDAKLAFAISKVTKKAFVRSPLTCETPRLLCQLCYGWSLSHGKLVSVGEAVGVIAAQSIGEPGTQLTMRTFHTGGVFAGGLTDQILAPFDGKIQYIENIPGTCIRTTLSEIAFFTKMPGSFFLQKNESSHFSVSFPEGQEQNKSNISENFYKMQKKFKQKKKNSFFSELYKIPAYAVLFFRNNEVVKKRQVLAQFSTLTKKQSQYGSAEQTLFSNFAGEFYLKNSNIPFQKDKNFQNIDLFVEKRNSNIVDYSELELKSDIVWKSKNWTNIWILSGKIFSNLLDSHFLIQKGDVVKKTSILQRILWKNPKNFDCYPVNKVERIEKWKIQKSYFDISEKKKNLATFAFSSFQNFSRKKHFFQKKTLFKEKNIFIQQKFFNSDFFSSNFQNSFRQVKILPFFIFSRGFFSLRGTNFQSFSQFHKFQNGKFLKRNNNILFSKNFEKFVVSSFFTKTKDSLPKLTLDTTQKDVFLILDNKNFQMLKKKKYSKRLFTKFSTFPELSFHIYNYVNIFQRSQKRFRIPNNSSMISHLSFFEPKNWYSRKSRQIQYLFNSDMNFQVQQQKTKPLSQHFQFFQNSGEFCFCKKKRNKYLKFWKISNHFKTYFQFRVKNAEFSQKLDKINPSLDFSEKQVQQLLLKKSLFVFHFKKVRYCQGGYTFSFCDSSILRNFEYSLQMFSTLKEPVFQVSFLRNPGKRENAISLGNGNFFFGKSFPTFFSYIFPKNFQTETNGIFTLSSFEKSFKKQRFQNFLCSKKNFLFSSSNQFETTKNLLSLFQQNFQSIAPPNFSRFNFDSIENMHQTENFNEKSQEIQKISLFSFFQKKELFTDQLKKKENKKSQTNILSHKKVSFLVINSFHFIENLKNSHIWSLNFRHLKNFLLLKNLSKNEFSMNSYFSHLLENTFVLKERKFLLKTTQNFENLNFYNAEIFWLPQENYSFKTFNFQQNFSFQKKNSIQNNFNKIHKFPQNSSFSQLSMKTKPFVFFVNRQGKKKPLFSVLEGICNFSSFSTFSQIQKQFQFPNKNVQKNSQIQNLKWIQQKVSFYKSKQSLKNQKYVTNLFLKNFSFVDKKQKSVDRLNTDFQSKNSSFFKNRKKKNSAQISQNRKRSSARLFQIQFFLTKFQNKKLFMFPKNPLFLERTSSNKKKKIFKNNRRINFFNISSKKYYGTNLHSLFQKNFLFSLKRKFSNVCQKKIETLFSPSFHNTQNLDMFSKKIKIGNNIQNQCFTCLPVKKFHMQIQKHLSSAKKNFLQKENKNFQTSENMFHQEKNIFSSFHEHHVQMNIQSGWIYIFPKISFFLDCHKILKHPGHFFAKDICFEQNKIFIRTILLNTSSLVSLSLNKEQNILTKNTSNFNEKKSTFSSSCVSFVQNKNCRFLNHGAIFAMQQFCWNSKVEIEKQFNMSVSKLEDRKLLASFFQPFSYKLIENPKNYKKFFQNLTLQNATKEKNSPYLSSSLHLWKSYHSSFHNLQKKEKMFLENMINPDVVLSSEFENIYFFENMKNKTEFSSNKLQKSHFSFDSGIHKKELLHKMSTFRTFSEKYLRQKFSHLLLRFNLSKPFSPNFRKFTNPFPKETGIQVFENQLFQNISVHKNVKKLRIENFLFSLYPLQFLPLNISYSRPNEKHDQKFPTIFVNSITNTLDFSFCQKKAAFFNQRLVSFHLFEKFVQSSSFWFKDGMNLLSSDFQTFEEKSKHSQMSFFGTKQKKWKNLAAKINLFENSLFQKNLHFYANTKFFSPFDGELIPMQTNETNWWKKASEISTLQKLETLFTIVTKKDLFSLDFLGFSKNQQKTMNFKLLTYFQRKIPNSVVQEKFHVGQICFIPTQFLTSQKIFSGKKKILQTEYSLKPKQNHLITLYNSISQTERIVDFFLNSINYSFFRTNTLKSNNVFPFQVSHSNFFENNDTSFNIFSSPTLFPEGKNNDFFVLSKTNHFQISYFSTKYENKIYKLRNLQVGYAEISKKPNLGKFFVYGDALFNYGLQKPGQIVHLSSSKVTLRHSQPFLVSPKGILHFSNVPYIEKNVPILTLPFQTLQSGDIVQGIPKVEQLFESRTTIQGRLFVSSLPILLKGIFQRYKAILPMEQAVRQSFLKIQQLIVDGVQRVYRSQGVSIIDKHLEVVVRQMTTKVQIIHGAQTGFFPGELVNLELVEKINKFLMVKIRYEPVVLGITRASLEVESFLSASSFQQTTKILALASISRKKDFLKGLKENLLVANLIPSGTGYMILYKNF